MENATQTRLELLKTEFELVQRQMDKYDTLSATTKTWAVTVWAAAVGWAFQTGHDGLFLVAALTILVFWFFDSLNKNFREDYKMRRGELEEALAHFYQTGELPEGFRAPNLPAHSTSRAFRRAAFPHLALPYLFLALLALFLFVV